MTRSSCVLHRVFDAQATLFPDTPAIRYQNRVLSYADVRSLSNFMACEILSTGIEPKSVVGVCVERSEYTVPALLGVLKAGCAYMPIGLDSPRMRTERMFHHSGCRFALTSATAGKNLPPSVSTLDVECFNNALEVKSSELPEVHSEDICYVLYTSGSTGSPKGVVVQHKSVVHLLNAVSRLYPLQSTSVFLLKTALTFDVSVPELFSWFFGGGSVSVLPQSAERDPAAILGHIRDQKVTHVNFVPSMCGPFLDEVTRSGNGLDTVEFIGVAGESFPAALAARVQRLGFAAKVFNLYGPTEATVYATQFALTDWDLGDVVPIGRAIDGYKTKIVDETGTECLDGEPGELCIGGVGVALGYLNESDLTCQRFRTLKGGRGIRWYMTGDIVSQQRKGPLRFHGRKDHQVKVRGFRIEMEEVEEAIRSIRGVNNSALICVTHQEENELIGFFDDMSAPSAEEVRRSIGEKLPSYMVPARLYRIPALPLTNSGKVDRKQLMRYSEDFLLAADPPIEQFDEFEDLVAQIWEKVLGRRPKSKNDDFFALGGSSLGTLRVAALIQEELGIELKLAELFNHSELSSLAQSLKGHVVHALASDG